jgi:hypothetical protein
LGIFFAYPSVEGLRLPKVLKNTTNIFPKFKYIYRDLRLRDEAIHDIKSMDREKDETVPKLPMEKLWLSSEKWNRPKEEKVVQSLIDYP